MCKRVKLKSIVKKKTPMMILVLSKIPLSLAMLNAKSMIINNGRKINSKILNVLIFPLSS